MQKLQIRINYSKLIKIIRAQKDYCRWKKEITIVLIENHAVVDFNIGLTHRKLTNWSMKRECENSVKGIRKASTPY